MWNFLIIALDSFPSTFFHAMPIRPEHKARSFGFSVLFLFFSLPGAIPSLFVCLRKLFDIAMFLLPVSYTQHLRYPWILYWAAALLDLFERNQNLFRSLLLSYYESYDLKCLNMAHSRAFNLSYEFRFYDNTRENKLI